MLKFYIYVTLIIAQFAAKRLAPSRFLCTPIKVMHVVACFFLCLLSLRRESLHTNTLDLHKKKTYFVRPPHISLFVCFSTDNFDFQSVSMSVRYDS